MAITPDITKAIRAWVGDDPADPTDVDITARWDRLGTVEDVAEEILKSRRANLVLADALSVDVTGDVKEDWTANLRALDADLKILRGQTASAAPTVAPVTMGSLERPDWSR